MKRTWFPAFLGAAVLGTALHFVYDLWPSPLTALLGPVNESVWEHLKLLFWPFLAAGFRLTHGQDDPAGLWAGLLTALLLMPLWAAGGYYLLKSGFRVESVPVDLALYYGALAAGFCLARHLCGRLSRAVGPLVIAAGLYGAALVLFSISPPELPIFLPG